MSYMDNGWWWYTALVCGVIYMAKGHTREMARIAFEDQLLEAGVFE